MVIWAVSNPTLISNYRLRSIHFLVIQQKIEEKDMSGIIGTYYLGTMIRALHQISWRMIDST